MTQSLRKAAPLRDAINSADSKFTLERSNLDNDSPSPGSKGELMRQHPIRWADDNEELQQTESQLVSQGLDSGHMSPMTSKTMTSLLDGAVEYPSCFYPKTPKPHGLGPIIGRIVIVDGWIAFVPTAYMQVLRKEESSLMALPHVYSFVLSVFQVAEM